MNEHLLRPESHVHGSAACQLARKPSAVQGVPLLRLASMLDLARVRIAGLLMRTRLPAARKGRTRSGSSRRSWTRSRPTRSSDGRRGRSPAGRQRMARDYGLAYMSFHKTKRCPHKYPPVHTSQAYRTTVGLQDCAGTRSLSLAISVCWAIARLTVRATHKRVADPSDALGGSPISQNDVGKLHN
jgi:hypothetical protein